MRWGLAITAMICAACASSSNHVREKPLLIFVLAGQSNMAGNDQVVPAERPYKNVYDVTFGSLRPAVDPLGDATGFGPGRAIGHELSRLHPRSIIGLVMCAQGSTGMDRWQDGGDLLTRCIDRTRDAQKRLGGQIGGVFFGQGENDTEHLATAERWAARFTTFVSAIRAAFGATPIVYAQLGRIPITPSFRDAYRWWNAVREQQASIRLSGVRMIHTSDIPSDVHYSWKGYQLLGRRYALADPIQGADTS